MKNSSFLKAIGIVIAGLMTLNCLMRDWTVAPAIPFIETKAKASVPPAFERGKFYSLLIPGTGNSYGPTSETVRVVRVDSSSAWALVNFWNGIGDKWNGDTWINLGMVATCWEIEDPSKPKPTNSTSNK